jgi:hypothetical protein
MGNGAGKSNRVLNFLTRSWSFSIKERRGEKWGGGGDSADEQNNGNWASKIEAGDWASRQTKKWGKSCSLNIERWDFRGKNGDVLGISGDADSSMGRKMSCSGVGDSSIRALGRVHKEINGFRERFFWLFLGFKRADVKLA